MRDEMGHHLTDERVHDLLDGEMDAVAERAARHHLERCDACAARVERVAGLLGDMAVLPTEALPARDLWSGIESRIRGETPVIPLPVANEVRGDAASTGAPSGGRRGWSGEAPVPTERAGARPRRRISVSLPQAWAAGIAIALMSGATVWTALNGARPQAVGPAAGAGLSGAVTPAGIDAPDSPLRTRLTSAAAYEEAVTELQALIEGGRHLLDPETLRTLEESMATIEAAIDEAEAALIRDPGSELLHRLILQHRQQRLRILQQTASGLPRV